MFEDGRRRGERASLSPMTTRLQSRTEDAGARPAFQMATFEVFARNF